MSTWGSGLYGSGVYGGSGGGGTTGPFWPAVSIEVAFGLLPGAATTWPLVMGDSSTFRRGVGGWRNDGGFATVALAPGTAPPGARNSLGMTCTTSGNAAAACDSGPGSVLPSTSYTVTAQIRAATVGRSCRFGFGWYDASGGLISTAFTTVTDSTSAWTAVSFTGTSPSNADHCSVVADWLGCVTSEVHFIGLVVADTTTNRWTDITRYVRHLDLQRSQRTYELNRFESGTATVTIDNTGGRFSPVNSSGPYWPNVRTMVPIRVRATWAGIRYNLWTGLVERWPQVWEDPALSEPQVTCVEWIAALSQNSFYSTYVEEVLLDKPVAFYPCTESSSSSGAGNLVGTDVAPIVVGRQGTAGTALGGTAVAYDGGSAVDFNPNAAPPAADYLDLSKAPSVNPSVATGWTFEIWALQNGAPPAVPSPLFTQLRADSSRAGFEIVISRTFLGQISLWVGNTVVYDSGGISFGTGPVYLVLSLDTGGTVRFYVNSATPVYTGTPTLGAVPVASVVGGDWFTGTTPRFSFKGFAGMIGVYNYALSATRINGHFQVGRLGGFLETTGQRAARLLTYAGWPYAPRSIQVGLSNAGSAGGTGLSGIDGNSALEALQDNNDAEGGQLYAAADGTVVFESRTYRASLSTPTHVWDPTGGLPYQLDAMAFDFDNTYVYNTVTVTRDGGPAQAKTDAGSATQYLSRTFSQTLKLAADSDVVDRVNYLVANYKDPHMRLPSLAFVPSGNTSVLFPIALDIDISDYESVTHRPIGAPAIPYLGYVDGISHSITVEPGSQSWTTALLLSPQFQQLWQLGALRTTVAANAAGGATSLTLNPLADRATNPAFASMALGAYQIIRAGALVGVVTVTAIGATTVGYTSFTVTVSPTGFAINAGDTICEPLPPGVTNPTVYDARSILGSTTILGA